MKFKVILAAIFALSLMACSKPTVPEPDSSTYGQTIKPDHRVPEKHQ